MRRFHLTRILLMTRISVLCFGLFGAAIAHAQSGTGELGSFNFDGSNPTSGLVATGAPAISTLNSHTPPKSLSFPAGNNYESYTLPSAKSVLYTRQYMEISSIGSNANTFLRLYHGGSELMAFFLNPTSGNPSYYNQAASTTTAISSTQLSTGSIHLVELYVKMSATAGQVICKIDGTTVYTSAATLNTGTSTIDTVSFGQLGSPAPAGWGTTYMDNVDLSAVGWIGPINPNPGSGELGSFNFDGSNPTSGLVATGAPAITTLNNHTPPNSLSFPAGNNYDVYTLSSATSVLYTRQYIEISSIGSTSNGFLRLYHGGNELMSIFLNSTDAHPSYYNQITGTSTTMSSTSFSAGSVHLIELYFKMSATAGQVICKIDGTTVYTSAATLNTGTSTVDTVWFGQIGNTAPVGWGTTYMDNVDFSAINWIGPINVAAPPVFSPAPGTYTTAQVVSLTDSTTGASIYYTTNGSTPTSASSLYTQAINVGSTETIQTVAIAPNYANSAIASGNYTIAIPPTLSGLSPASGAVGTSVSISGSNFGASQGTSTVSFDGTTASPINWSASSIVVPVPTGATTGNVVVTVGGTSSNGSLFTVIQAPSISGLSPSSGGVGTSVTISGSNFGASQGTSSVRFNGVNATPSSWSATSIVVPVPTGATTGSVVVTVGGASSNGSLFTVSQAPVISVLLPSSGAVGTSVTISGVNFGGSQGTSTVRFNGTSTTPISWSTTSIVVTVPSGAATGNIVVTVGGQNSNGSLFTVSQTPCGQCHSPNLTLSCTPTTVAPPQTAVCTAKLSPTASGSVSMGTSSLDTRAVQPDETGTATVPDVLVSAPAGTYTFTASYPGDNYFAPATASALVAVHTGSTTPTMTMTCSPTDATVKPATCTAQLPVGSTGYVAFTNGSFHSFAPINAGGQATISTEFVGQAQGTYSIGANYGGDTTYTAASANATVVVNNGTPTSESLASQASISCTPSTVLAPQTAACTAQVPVGAQGAVTFSYGQVSITVPVDGIGYARAYNLLIGAAAGSYTITASYSGDSVYAASSANTSVTLVQAGTNPGTVPDIQPPTIAMGCNSPINLNGSAQCTAWVSVGATGYITFWNSATGRTVAVPIDASGYAVAPNEVGGVPAGSYSVVAAYGGDQTYVGYWTFVGVTVGSSGLTTAGLDLSCTPTSVTSSGTITCTAQLPAGATGSVGFQLDGTSLGIAAINGQGTATLSATITASAGAHLILAFYGGDTNFTPASANLPLVVQTVPTITWSAPAPITYGTPLSATQLNATANVPGTFTYAPAAGTILAPGSQTLSVTFTPTDTSDYTSATATAMLTVQSAASGPWIINTVAGDYAPGNGGNGFSGDGGPATSAELQGPHSVAVDSAGNFYIADGGNNRIRKVTLAGIISTVAGDGGSGYYSGDGGPATAAVLYGPTGVAIDSSNNLYIADDQNNVIRKVTASTGVISTIAGCGTCPAGYAGDGGQATSAVLYYPTSVALDSAGNIYIADHGNHRIRKVNSATGVITTVAGNGVSGSGTVGEGGYSGDGGLATNAELNFPNSVAIDSSGNIYIADTDNNRIREVKASSGTITTIVGNGTAGFSGDTGLATNAEIDYPLGVAVDGVGNIYFSDALNYRIREVTASTGQISTIAGNGTGGLAGDGGPATSAELFYSSGLAINSAGNIYIADSGNSRVRELTSGKATPSITWATPFPIINGTALSATQLNATANTPGTLTYSPAAGTILAAGSQTLSVSFTPTDTTDYTTVTATVTLVVNQATPIVTWANPADIPYGTALSATQLDATSNVPGTFVYSPAAGTVLSVGPHTLTATFTPTDTTDYGNIAATAYIAVTDGMNKWDTGTVALVVNGSTVSTASYGQSSTPASIAAALASNLSAGSPVNVTDVDDALYLEAKTPGAASNSITYSLQNAGYDSTDFSQPSFPSSPESGSLEGGANQGATSGAPVYSYQVPSNGYDGVGNLRGVVDSVMGTWTFSYDSLNRLAGATDNQSGNPSTNYCWGYDLFGNRTIQAGSSAAFQTTSSTCTPASGASLVSTWANFNTKNQITGTTQAPGGLTYDAAGGVVNDGVNQYLYDGEGRICAVANGSSLTGYIYDADGQRVAKGTISAWSCDPTINGFRTTNDYVLGPSGEQVTEMGMDANNTMAWQHTNVYAAGKLLATYDNNGLHFYLNDPLGTRRAQTDYAGVLEQTCSSLPFGDGLSCTNSTQYPTEHHFTGKERDAESGNDYFGARYYASSMGRFLSPDWA